MFQRQLPGVRDWLQQDSQCFVKKRGRLGRWKEVFQESFSLILLSLSLRMPSTNIFDLKPTQTFGPVVSE